MTPFEILQEAADAVGGWDALRERLGVTRQAIWYWQAGKRQPNAQIVIQCMKILALTPARS